jgi:hypothetical protein
MRRNAFRLLAPCFLVHKNIDPFFSPRDSSRLDRLHLPFARQYTSFRGESRHRYANDLPLQ